jgi:hypothetical protein
MNRVIIIFIIICSFNLNAQEAREYKSKVSVDGTYLLSFFKTEEARLTPFNIKLSLNDKYNFRTGFNINTSTSSNKGFEGDLKIGIDISHPYAKKWSYYYGADINGAYFNYNDRDNSTMILSFMPFLGFEVFLAKEFSLSYEPKLIFNHYKYSNPSAIINQESYNEEIKLTGLSQFFINFNF